MRNLITSLLRNKSARFSVLNLSLLHYIEYLNHPRISYSYSTQVKNKNVYCLHNIRSNWDNNDVWRTHGVMEPANVTRTTCNTDDVPSVRGRTAARAGRRKKASQVLSSVSITLSPAPATPPATSTTRTLCLSTLRNGGTVHCAQSCQLCSRVPRADWKLIHYGINEIPLSSLQRTL